jgi:WD40 repeat protein
VNGCAVSADGSIIASASQDRTVRVWDGRSGRLLHILEGHTNWVMGCAVSGDGSLIASASVDQTVRVWDGKTGRCLAIFTRTGRRSAAPFTKARG